MTDTELRTLGVIIATLGGVAIGVERERSGHARGPAARFAGVRTFTLLGGLAGLAGWLWASRRWRPRRWCRFSSFVRVLDFDAGRH